MSIFKKGFVGRIMIIGLIIAFLFTADAGRLFYIQIIKGEDYKNKAESQQLSDTEIEAKRGTIYDSEGNVLAQSATVWTVFLDPSNINQETTRTKVVDYLASTFGYDDEQKAKLTEKAKAANQYQVVEKNVENRVKEKIAEFVSENKLAKVIGFQEATERYYPYGSLASSVIGFMGEDSGLAGIEAYYNDELTGTNGRLITAKDAKSNSISNDYETTVDPQDGYSLNLTINTTIQYYLEKELQRTLEEYSAKGCYGVVMIAKRAPCLQWPPCRITIATSRIKSLIKNIRMSSIKLPMQPKNGKQSEYVQRQWRNFTVSDTYVPGSVFKTFMASAVLEEGVATLDTKYTCNGYINVDKYRMNCHYHAGHGTQTLTQGLENSCNPFFITLGQRLGVHNYFK